MADRPSPSAAKERAALAPVDTRAAIDALVRLRGKAEDKQLIAETMGLLAGRVEFLLDVLIAAAIERTSRGR